MQKFSNSNKINKVKIRHANKNDIYFTLKLHNENVLKKKFFSKKKVNFKNHKLWFDNKIKEKKLFICHNIYKVGYVRYDLLDKDKLSVSIAVKEKFKRQGYGKVMLKKTLKRKEISKFNIVATVKSDNLVSKKFFLDTGFKFYKKNIYILNKNT